MDFYTIFNKLFEPGARQEPEKRADIPWEGYAENGNREEDYDNYMKQILALSDEAFEVLMFEMKIKRITMTGKDTEGPDTRFTVNTNVYDAKKISDLMFLDFISLEYENHHSMSFFVDVKVIETLSQNLKYVKALQKHAEATQALTPVIRKLNELHDAAVEWNNRDSASHKQNRAEIRYYSGPSYAEMAIRMRQQSKSNNDTVL